jgi:hypothetical protein
MKIIDWVVRIIPAAILLQTLYFKFTASPESVFIFSTLGVEPWGRWRSNDRRSRYSSGCGSASATSQYSGA